METVGELSAPAYWHPMVVHFPLALILTAAACLTLDRLLPASHRIAPLSLVGTWNLVLGTVGVLLALGTGLAAAMHVEVGAAAHQAIGAHFKSAMVTTLLVLGAGLWRGLGTAPDSRPSWLFMILLWAASAALVLTAYRGGQNVYRHGIGVAVHASNSPLFPPKMRHNEAQMENCCTRAIQLRLT